MKPTFVLCKDWINYTNEMSNEDRGMLLNAIMQYQNGLDPGELPYAVKIVFAHIRNFFVEQEKKYEEIKEKRSESGKKGGRPTTEKAKKANAFSGKQTKAKKATESKQKLTETDTITDTSNSHSNEGENNSNELLDSSNNSLFILKYNTETGQIEKIETNIVLYGKMDGDVEKVLAMIKGSNDGALDGSTKANRNDAKNLAKKIQDLEAVKEGRTNWEAVLAMILGVMKDDKYYGSKLSSPKEIYDNFGKLVAQSRIKIQEMQQKQSKKSEGVF
ncbi:MAG: hypothetical protein DLD55_01245 [candidate division SR1 bacterium]|nr:MAG: hypothetical protein DLD55_01245 [candidate division SR1 bacterium]